MKIVTIVGFRMVEVGDRPFGKYAQDDARPIRAQGLVEPVEEYETGIREQDADKGEELLVGQREHIAPVLLRVQTVRLGQDMLEAELAKKRDDLVIWNLACASVGGENLPQAAPRREGPLVEEADIRGAWPMDPPRPGGREAGGGPEQAGRRLIGSSHENARGLRN